MKITFEKTQKDFNLFFNMLAVNKVFAEIAEKYDPDFSPPLSAIDYLIQKIGGIIQNEKLYTTTLQESDTTIKAICSYMIGTGSFSITNEISFFGINYQPNDYVIIDKKKLWEKICLEGIEL